MFAERNFFKEINAEFFVNILVYFAHSLLHLPPDGEFCLPSL